MASSNTYAYGPAASNLMLTAFGRCLMRRAELTTQHLADAENEANLLQVTWANAQPNLWTSELYTVNLTAGDGDYDLPARMIAIQAAYLNVTSGDVSTDRILWPLSVFEYASLPNKTQEGPPTSYWYDRTITPSIKLWPVPDDAATYVLKFRILHQIQDVSLRSGTNLDLPYRWLDAWVAALAARLGAIYPDALIKAFGPNGVNDLRAQADKAWANAATEDKERVPMYLNCATSMYFQ